MLKRAGEMIDENVFETVIPEVDMSVGEAVSGALAEESKKRIEKRLEELVCESFDVDSENVAVTVLVAVTDGAVSLDRVTVWLSGTALMTDPREIDSLIAEYTNAECEIVGGKP
jgi:hypothetical protein